MTKPSPGLGIDWRHKFAKGLVHSYPFNEGQGDTCKNYAWPQGQFDLKFRLPNVADTPQWGTFFRVPGLQIDIDQSNPLVHVTNTGSTSPDQTGSHLLPVIDYTKGFTVHLWMRPTESLVGAVSAYNFVNIGPVNEGVGITFLIGLTRGPDGAGGDCWKPLVRVYSNGTTSADFGGSFSAATPWDAPFPAGRVKIDSLPFEHVISVQPGSPVMWYASDGNAFNLGTLSTVITPADGNQYWPQFSISGQPQFEGHLWATNIWNYAMGQESAFTLMRNPLQMYKARSTGGGYGANVFPGGVDPPTTDGDVPGTVGPDPDRFTGATPTPYSDGNQFIYYKHHYEFMKDPLDTTRLDSYDLDFGWQRWKFIRRLWIAGISQSTITLQIFIDEVSQFTTTFSLVPASGTGWKRTTILLPPNLKGQLFRIILTAASSFKIFLDQSDIEWHPLSTDRGYQRFPFALSAMHERGGTIN